MKKAIKESGKEPQYAEAMRLVQQETVHGQFVRFGFVTWEVDTKRVVKFEPAPIVFNSEEEATQLSYQMANAAQMGVLVLRDTTFKPRMH